MKRMKANHVKVVDRIQDQYKSIDDDVQVPSNEQYVWIVCNTIKTQLDAKITCT